MKQNNPYSDLKIFYHTKEIAKMVKGERVAPIYVRIKPTNVCNQRCYYCVYENDNVFNDREVEKRESIPWKLLEKTLIELKEMGTKAVTFSGGGEPLCYHSILDTLNLVDKLGMDYSIITNGQALIGEAAEKLYRAKWIRISFDSYFSDTYTKVRNVDTHKQVIKNIEDFAKRKSKTCTLGINCVITKNNANEIYDLCKLSKDIGVDNIKLSPVLVNDSEEKYHNAIKDDVIDQIRRAKMDFEDTSFHIVDKYSNDYALSEKYIKSYNRCYIQEYFCVIAADSKVYRCHQRAYTKPGEIGDLLEKTMKEIWYDPKIISNARKWNPCNSCNFRCAFDERNVLLDNFMNMDLNHVNFV